MKDFITILGASGGKSQKDDLISIKLTDKIIIDAGNIMNSKDVETDKIEHIFITHAHLDHIADIGLLIDSTFSKRIKPLKIYGSSGTLNAIKQHILNWEIWPDFTEICLIGSKLKAIELIVLDIGNSIIIDGLEIKSIQNNHTATSNGYIVTNSSRAICFTSDTYLCDSIWNEINTNSQIKIMIIEISFPSYMGELAKNSKHLTPELFKEQLQLLKRTDIQIFINHIKPSYKVEIVKELDDMYDILNGGKILNSGDIIKY